MCVYIYIYMHTYIHTYFDLGRGLRRPRVRRRLGAQPPAAGDNN